MKLKNKEYKYLIPKKIDSMRKLYLNDNKDIIKDILLENFKVGDSNDSVKMTEVKNVLKKNSDFKDKDVISIIYLIQEIFPEAEYKFDNIIDGKRLSRTFHKISNI